MQDRDGGGKRKSREFGNLSVVAAAGLHVFGRRSKGYVVGVGLLSENHFPIFLHIDDYPVLCTRFIERFIELAYVRLTVVSPFAFGTGVPHQTGETRAGARSGPLKHFQISIRIAEREDWSPANKLLNTGGFPWSIVHKFNLSLTHKHRHAISTSLELSDEACTNYLFRRNSINLLGEYAHEFYRAA